MCRKHQLWGMLLLAWGTGVLVGTLIPSHFFCVCLGAGGIGLGIFLLCRK